MPLIHFLDALSIWCKEFTSALASRVPVIAWIPQLSWTGTWQRWEYDCDIEDPPLRARLFPIQRGFRRSPVGWLSRTPQRLSRRLLAASAGFSSPVLILTSPYYARLAALWEGPTVYYVTDLLTKYGGFSESQIRRLDKQMCRTVSLVCPNSTRIAHYLRESAKCPAEKIVVVPNATRSENLLPRVPAGPAALPRDLADLPRPVAGVIGNLAANMDWQLLEQVVDSTPFLSWAFVGPTTGSAGTLAQHRSRSRLIGMGGGRLRFTGEKPYGLLRDYARALDVAVLPYRKVEPTYSGSSTRFYEHLAACRPMVASNFAELLEKEPLLHLASNAEQMITRLNDLESIGFSDGYEELRWKVSLGETWEARASLMLAELTKRVLPDAPAQLDFVHAH
jgi:glycosyltransferase involved in cell wall biosynthesis